MLRLYNMCYKYSIMKSKRVHEISLRMNNKELNQLKRLKQKLGLKDNSKTIRYSINRVFNEIKDIITDNTATITIDNDLLEVISKIAKKNETTEKIILNSIIKKGIITDYKKEYEKEKLERISINDKLSFYKKSSKEKDFNEIIEIATDTGFDELIDSVEAKNKIYLDKAR